VKLLMEAPQADFMRRQPPMGSPPFSKGDVCEADRGILMGCGEAAGSQLANLNSQLFLYPPQADSLDLGLGLNRIPPCIFSFLLYDCI
jgi:hypothetical protein